MTDSAELARLIEPLARRFWGEPNPQHSTRNEPRWGTNGSKKITIDQGTWYDYQDEVGGGVLDLVKREEGLTERKEQYEWFEREGYLPNGAGRAPGSARAKPNGQDRQPPPSPPPPDEPPPGPSSSSGKARIVEVYDYLDKDGGLLFQVCRLFPKTFRQRRPDPAMAGEWIWSVKGVKLVPYRLPELIETIKAGCEIYIPEGEKDVDRLRAIGLAATCNPMGAGKWKPEFAQYFVGANVIVLPDNDPQKTKEDGTLEFHADGRPKFPGQDHARAVCTALAPVAAKVRYLDLSQHWAAMPLKGDVSDWLDDGEGSAEKLTEFAKHATIWLKIEASSGTKRGPPPPPGTTAPEPEHPLWYFHLRGDEKGRVIPDLRNALIAIRGEVKLAGAFTFDEMAQEAMLMKPPPLAPGAKSAPPCPHAVTDDDVSRLQEWLQHCGIPKIGRETVGQAIHTRAREFRFHPLLDELNALGDAYDGEPRIGLDKGGDGEGKRPCWLATYLGTPDDDYHREIGARFLIAMVKRVFKPGCQSDYMLVLEGPQGAEKSKLCRALAGDKYFSDGLPESITSKDARQHLRGKWLIEFSELAAFGKAAVEALKAFITRREEKYRPPYARSDVVERRQCVFIGTTNDDEWNPDATGGRRFWPVKVVKIDLDGFKAARDQLLGEAVQAYRRGEPSYPAGDFEKTIIAPIQAERQSDDSWTETVMGAAEKTIATMTPKGCIKTKEIAAVLGFAKEADLDMNDARRIGSIMRKHGWEKGKQWGKPGKYWTKK